MHNAIIVRGADWKVEEVLVGWENLGPKYRRFMFGRYETFVRKNGQWEQRADHYDRQEAIDAARGAVAKLQSQAQDRRSA